MYLLIENFNGGLDTRRSALTSRSGTLQVCSNAHINRGGEIEKRKAFAPFFTLPDGTYGLQAAGGKLYVFGSNPVAPVLPSVLTYQYLAPPIATGSFVVTGGTHNVGTNYLQTLKVNGVNIITGTVDMRSSVSGAASAIAANINATATSPQYTAVAYSGKVTIYAKAGASPASQLIPNGFVLSPVTQGDMTLGSITNLSGGSDGTLTGILSSDSFNGKPYVVASFSDGGVYHYYNGSRVVEWDQIALTANDSDLSATAALLASRISGSQYFTAISTGAVISISATSNNAPFGCQVFQRNGGSLDDAGGSITVVQVATPTQPLIANVTLSGTFEPSDEFRITLTPSQTGSGIPFTVAENAAGTGLTCRTFKKKVFSCTSSLLYFSDVDTPTSFNGFSGSGGGFINMTNQDGGSEALTGVAAYQSYMAVFSRHAVQIWTMDPDPTQSAQLQVISNIGTFAARSVVTFGASDVFFLSDAGIRSLRARDASNFAVTNDVGTNIDLLVNANIQTLDNATRAAAVGVVDPIDGRYWLAVGDTIYVYSYFPGPGIQAWSTYSPGFVISEFSVLNGRIYCRSGNTIYLYGGSDGNTYDSCPVNVVLPYLDGGKPAHSKSVTAIDAALDGNWSVYLGADITAPNARSLVANLTGSTYNGGDCLAMAQGTHISVQLTNSSPGYARISNFAVHFDIDEAG